MTRKLVMSGLLLTGSWMMVAPTVASAQVAVGISVGAVPPPLPVYEQPQIPGPGYLWTPGYWAWDEPGGYYWVPGAWTLPPRPGLLWTPAWWGWEGGSYLFHRGYWGPRVGFYGGIDYGFGYTGSGFQGAYWRGGRVFYNRSVTNINNVHITNVYNKTVVRNVNVRNRTSFNGGPNGIQARPTEEQRAYGRQNHVPPTEKQQQHVATARADPQASFKANRGQPAKPASQHPAGERRPTQQAPGQRSGQPGGEHPGQAIGSQPGRPDVRRPGGMPGDVEQRAPDRGQPNAAERADGPARRVERGVEPPRDGMGEMRQEGRPAMERSGAGGMERPRAMEPRFGGGGRPGGGPRGGGEPHPEGGRR